MNEDLPGHLEEFDVIARVWHRSRNNSDSEIQAIRVSERIVGERLLQGEVARHKEHRKQIILHVGERALKAIRFQDITYGFTIVKQAELAPDSQLSLVWQAKGPIENSDKLEPYYGQFEYVNFPTIAQALNEGGRLESIDFTEPTPASLANE